MARRFNYSENNTDEDKFDGFGNRSENAPDFSEPKDYSTPSDTNTYLDEAEKKAGSDEYKPRRTTSDKSGSNKDIGLSQMESGTPWNTSSANPLRQTKNGSGFKNWFSNHKKGAVGWLIALAMGGGMFGLGMGVSGFAQLPQMMNFIKDTKLWINGAQTGERYMFTMSNIYQTFKNGNGERIQNQRLNIASRRLASSFEKRLAANGLTFQSNAFGNSTMMTLDYGALTGNQNYSVKDPTEPGIDGRERSRREDAMNRHKKAVAEKMDILGIKSYSVGSDGKIAISDKISSSAKRKLMSAINNVGKFDMISKMASRLMLSKYGKLSVLHPIKNIEKAAFDKLDDFIRRAVNNIENGSLDLPEDVPNKQLARDKAESNKKKQLEERNNFLSDNQKLSTSDIDKAVKEAGDAAEEAFTKSLEAKKNGIMQRTVMKVAEKLGGDALKSALKLAMQGLAVAGVASMAITALCMLQDALDNAGPYKMQSVITAIGAVMSFMGTVSAIMTGDDVDDNPITPEIVGNTVNMYLNDNVPVSYINDKGETVTTGETQFKTAWAASPVACELGEGNTNDCAQGVGSTDDEMPAGLTGVGNRGSTFFPKNVNDILTTIFTGGSSPINAICWVANQYNDAVNKMTDFFMGWLINPIMKAIMDTGLGSLLSNMMQSLQSVLYGKLLSQDTLAAMTPTGWGFVMMFGAKFSDNAQNRVWGRTLSKTENIQLAQEQKEYLAWQQSQKSLLARLFDTTDYSSAVNRIARASNIDTSNKGILTQLSNVGKIFASTPRLFGMAFNLFGNSTYAEPLAGSMDYDYGVPTMAFSKSEMDKITTDSEYQFYPNQQIVVGSDGKPGLAAKPDIQSKMKSCFGITLSSDGNVTMESNDKAQSWDYVKVMDNESSKYGGSECQGDDLLRVRTYVMDTYNIMSQDCYENNGWAGGESSSSCSEQNESESSSTGTPGSANTSTDGSTCAAGTNSLGVYPNAHENGQQISIQLCEVTSIKLSEPGFYTSQDPDIFRSTKSGGIVVGAATSDAFQKMGEAAKAGGNPLSGKGIRSFEKQQYFYDCYNSKKCNNGNLAAKPGTSQHESGKAVDFSSSSIGWLQKNARTYGLCATVSNENWHYAPSAGRACYFGSGS